ncbi:hypothetical protein K8T06_00285 [bacterium]|nr:hypothetical protein [bacterium]
MRNYAYNITTQHVLMMLDDKDIWSEPAANTVESVPCNPVLNKPDLRQKQ